MSCKTVGMDDGYKLCTTKCCIWDSEARSRPVAVCVCYVQLLDTFYTVTVSTCKHPYSCNNALVPYLQQLVAGACSQRDDETKEALLRVRFALFAHVVVGRLGKVQPANRQLGNLFARMPAIKQAEAMSCRHQAQLRQA